MTKLVRPLARSRVPMLWGEDRLFAILGGFDRVRPPAGCIYKVDPEGKDWELWSVGLRNPFDAAFNRHGDLFIYDSDTYLDDRKTRGFGAVLVNLLEHKFCTHPLQTQSGLAPFKKAGDFTTPNDDYVDYAVALSGSPCRYLALEKTVGLDVNRDGAELEAALPKCCA